MKRLCSSLTALFLACCLLMPLGAGGLVLCIGADRHMTFEPARNSRCTTPIAPTLTPSQQITPLTSQPDHCGPCVDVPLLTSEGNQQLVPASPPLVTLDGPVLTLALPVISLPAAPAASTSAWSFFPAVSPVLIALRTVVLLL